MSKISKDDLSYRSFIWCLGTTSFRTKEFNLSIEMLLSLLNEFWLLNNNSDKKWSGNNEIQTAFYKYISEKWYQKGSASRPDKDARQITSGLVSLGLINNERRLTEAGIALLDVFNSQDYSSNNFLNIDKDSFIYFKQLLKTSINIGDNSVRPLLVLFYLIEKFNILSFDEFRYLLPLCVDENSLNYVCDSIEALRSKRLSINDVIIKIITSKSNYKDALDVFLDENVDEDLICSIGLNRKSKSYDRAYYPVYMLLKAVVLEKNDNEIYNLFKLVSKLNLSSYWKRQLFQINSELRIAKMKRESLKDVKIFQVNTENEFKIEFFNLMHLCKTLATLDDYFDLNRRYFKLTDFFTFEDNMISLSVMPRAYVDCFSGDIYHMLFEDVSSVLPRDVKLSEISKIFDEPEESVLCENINKKYKLSISSTESVDKFINDERYTRFNRLLKKKFPISRIVDLFEMFKNRQDDLIKAFVTDNADIPTIFEYIVGIAWYYISEQKGDVLSFMKLSLDSDLLPKTHAGGGTADIIWEYEKSNTYPKHSLLIEATLTQKDTQRRAEMEPVSRHLGKYILDTGKNAYAMFVSDNLDLNVISDFLSRKNIPFWDNSVNPPKKIDGLKILPVKLDAIKEFLLNKVYYADLYSWFDFTHNTIETADEWHIIKMEN